jgi:hypothetical protein
MKNSILKLGLAVAVAAVSMFGWFSCTGTTCDASNCMGCCDNTGTCIKQTSTAACGLNGAMCVACTEPDGGMTPGTQCKAGVCTPPTAAGGGTAGTGGGSGSTGGGSGSTGGGSGSTGGGSGSTGGGTASMGGGTASMGGGTGATGGGTGGTGGGCNGTMLTVKNAPIGTPWCKVSINGSTAVVTPAVQTACVTPGQVTLTAEAESSTFELGLWHHTSGDTGSGEPGSVSAGVSTAHFIADGGATACVWVCCPFAAMGNGCPTTDQCP